MAGRRRKELVDGKIAGLYDLGETIGQGHFATVKLARHVFTGEKVAVKVIDKTKLDEVSKAHLFQEVRCMKLVQHPNVVRLYEVIDTQTKLFLILELGDGGDMYDFITKHEKGLDEMFARQCFKQLVQAISYCHHLHVVHRDLKPENVVFFEKQGIVKLTDFGFSNKYIPGKQLDTSCGSLAYSAPEILLGDSYDPPAVDVWSLGVLLFMLVSGEPPFQEANDSETLTMIMDCRYTMPKHVSEECQNLISMLLNREPSQRPNLHTIAHHPWVASSSDPLPESLPLVTLEDISTEEHEYIVRKMIEGEIATKDEILESLDNDKYDYITATYYLLAERRLRRHSSHAIPQNRDLVRMQSYTQRPKLEPLALSPRCEKKILTRGNAFVISDSDQTDNDGVMTGEMTPEQLARHNAIQSLVSPPASQPANLFYSTSSLMQECSQSQSKPIHSHSPPTRIRKFSLIKEESMEEDSDNDDIDVLPIHKVKFAKTTDDCASDDSESYSSSSETNMSLRTRNSHRSHTHTRSRPLHAVKSSPQLLNQIFEEGESEDDDIMSAKVVSPRMIKSRNSVASPEVLRKFSQKLRIKKKHKGKHGASCSSSDASDNDETEKRKRKEKLKHFHRRDSSDHSSDTDGPGGCGGPTPQNGGSSIQQSTDNNNSSGTKGGDQQDKQQTKNNSSGGKQQRTLAPVAEQPTEKESKDTVDIEAKNEVEADTDKKGFVKSPTLIDKRGSGRLTPRGSSFTSNLSNLSLSSLRSSSSKYKVDYLDNGTLYQREPSNDSMNNLFYDSLSKASNTRLIHVVSKEFSDKFSDICEKFSRASSREGSIRSENISMCSADCSLNHFRGHMRSRDKVKVKLDMNCNGYSQDEMRSTSINSSPVAKKRPVECCVIS